MLDSAYPPSYSVFEQETLEGDIALMLCHGESTDAIYDALTQDPDDDPWQEREILSDPVPDTLEEIIEAVVEEYVRLVPEDSADARAFDAAVRQLAEEGVVFSFDEGWDKGEAAQEGYEKGTEVGAKGYGYCTMQDVDTVIHSGTLYIGFSSLSQDEDESVAVGQAICEALKAQGLNPEWKGTTRARIVCENLRFELALED